MLRLTLVEVAFFLAVSPVVHAQSRFTVGTASAAPGEKSSGTIEVPAGIDAATSITVILVPLINIQSFEQKVPHVNPIDNKSMNRFYPGKTDGTQTERASYLITKEIVDRCDYLIDYHGGDLDESLRPYAYWGPTGREAQDAVSKEMVLAFGLDHVIIWRERRSDAAAARYLDNSASVGGKPSIVVE